MEKKGKGKTIIIVILVFAVLGLGGYIAYDKVNESNKTNSLEKEVKQLNNEIATLKTEKIEDNKENADQKEENTTADNNYINAVYYGYKEDATNGNNPKEFLALFSDGTYTDLLVDAGGNTGTYEIRDNKLILHTPKTAMSDGGDVTLEISQDKTQVIKDGLSLRNYK